MRETLIVLGMAALFILAIVGTAGAREFRPQLRRAASLVPLFTPGKGKHQDPARAVSASARRKPDGVESRRAAGTVPDAGGVWPGGPASGTAGRLLTTAELARLHPHGHRPVNGRLLGDQPRTYGQAPAASVRDAERIEEERQAACTAGEWARLTGIARPADSALLERVHAGLLALPPAPVVYPCCTHCENRCRTPRHITPCEPCCPGAQPIGGAE
jgi:hypothetical protein